MTTDEKNQILIETAEAIEVSETAYKTAIKRYEDLGEWFGRNGSTLAQYDPLVDVQGSFATGTATKPLEGDMDLDLFVVLQKGISRQTHSQQNLVELIQFELELYRQARGIKDPIIDKKRCLRLNYQGETGFHMDILPAIPGDQALREALQIAANRQGLNVHTWAEHALHITDNTKDDFDIISLDWNSSNPRGYREWFIQQMNLAQSSDVRALVEAQVNDVPVYRRKTPLQIAVQILKRHRDVMFRNDSDDIKPISIIISTLAAQAYQGENSLDATLEVIIQAIVAFANNARPVLVNPVKRDERFTDRWESAEGQRLGLQQAFHGWARAVRRDFEILSTSIRRDNVERTLREGFSVSPTLPSLNKLSKGLGAAAAPTVITSSQVGARPWGKTR